MTSGNKTVAAHSFGFIPNLLTALRIAFAVAFPFTGEHARIVLLVGALLTEFFDGVLARRFGWQSRLGRLVDPVADKILFGTVAITFLLEGRLSWFALAALSIRDANVALGALWVLLRGQRRTFLSMQPHFSGKLTTALQYSVLLCTVLGFALPWLLLAATFAVGTVAAAHYYSNYRRIEAGFRQPDQSIKQQ